MSLAERCDEIARLIDATLAEMPALPPLRTAVDEESEPGKVHADDGRWHQLVPRRGSEPRDVAA